ncbi:hypothetical protein DFH09DRAFT_1119776 [Mycena vulgaris]|nr:hypothetical protein DFH09DRAFT_1119776 [Mycena vulgaris]
MEFEVGKLTIPLFIGTVLNWALLGSLVVQVYIYFLAFPNDRRVNKILVAFICVAETLQTLGDSRNTIRSFGAGWGDPKVLDDVGWAWLSVPILGSTIAAVGQLFFAWRIWIIGKNLWVPGVITAVTTVQLGAGIWTGVEIARARHFSRLSFSALKPPVAWLAATAASDLLIVTGTVFYVLKARQPGFQSSTQAVLGRIIKVTVETGLLCAIFASVDLYLFVAFNGNNYHLAVCIWLSKVYSNSIMVILNSRAYIGHTPPPGGGGRMTGMTDIMFQSGSRGRTGTAVQVSIETDSTADYSSQFLPSPQGDEDKVLPV